MGMGLVEAVASLSGHESGHLQNSAHQQVNLSIHLLHMFIDNSVYVDASIQNVSFQFSFDYEGSAATTGITTFHRLCWYIQTLAVPILICLSKYWFLNNTTL